MSLNNKTKSILLQVAFKAAVDNTSDDTDPIAVEQMASVMYESLLALHERYGIEDQSMGSGDSSGSTAPSTGDAPEVTIDGVVYQDFRGLKALGAVDANFPDFKQGTKGYWLTKKDGSPTKFAIDNKIPELVS